MNNKNIGIIGFSAYTGGGLCVYWLKKHLNINSHFVIHSNHFTKNLLDNNSTITYNNSEKDFLEYINKYKPDIMFMLGTPFNFNYFNILHKKGIKTIIIPMVDSLKKEIFKDYINYIDVIICSNKYCYNHFSTINKEFASKTIYIPYPIDTDYFKPSNYVSNCFFFHNQGNGGAHWRKGTDSICLSFDTFRQKHNEATLCINEQTTLHPFYQIPKNIENIKIIIKNYEEQKDIYKNGQVYLGTSKREGIGLPILEAMSCGLPVITTNAPPMNEYFAPNYPLLVDYSDTFRLKTNNILNYIINIKDMITKMELIYNNHSLIKELGQQNRKQILDNYSWKVLKEKYVNLINSCQN